MERVDNFSLCSFAVPITDCCRVDAGVSEQSGHRRNIASAGVNQSTGIGLTQGREG